MPVSARDQDDLRPTVHAHDAEELSPALMRLCQFSLEELDHLVVPVLERHGQRGAAVLPRLAHLCASVILPLNGRALNLEQSCNL